MKSRLQKQALLTGFRIYSGLVFKHRQVKFKKYNKYAKQHVVYHNLLSVEID